MLCSVFAVVTDSQPAFECLGVSFASFQTERHHIFTHTHTHTHTEAHTGTHTYFLCIYTHCYFPGSAVTNRVILSCPLLFFWPSWQSVKAGNGGILSSALRCGSIWGFQSTLLSALFNNKPPPLSGTEIVTILDFLTDGRRQKGVEVRDVDGENAAGRNKSKNISTSTYCSGVH